VRLRNFGLLGQVNGNAHPCGSDCQSGNYHVIWGPKQTVHHDCFRNNKHVGYLVGERSKWTLYRADTRDCGTKRKRNRVQCGCIYVLRISRCQFGSRRHHEQSDVGFVSPGRIAAIRGDCDWRDQHCRNLDCRFSRRPVVPGAGYD
jgi:hypothetical protein